MSNNDNRRVVFIRTSGIYNDSRSIKEIQALTEAGYYVDIIGWDRDGKAKERCNLILSHKNIFSINLFDCRAENGVGGRNSYKLLLWFKWLSRKLNDLNNDKRIETIHACDFDAGIVSFAFCKKHSVKLVYDIFDYYIDAHSIPSIFKNAISNMENKIINRSNLTIICTEERKEQIKGTNPRKLVVVHNSPDIEEKSIYNCEKVYDYSYCGSLCDKRLIKEILEEYPNNNSLILCFAGYGLYSKEAEKLADKQKNFKFLGPISYSEVLCLEAQSKVLSAVYDPRIRNHRLCAPNKFYEAMALGLPIIVCRGTGIDVVVENNNIGIVIEYDAKQFFNSIEYLINHSNEAQMMGDRARELYDKKYSWGIMKKRLIDAYDSIY